MSAQITMRVTQLLRQGSTSVSITISLINWLSLLINFSSLHIWLYISYIILTLHLDSNMTTSLSTHLNKMLGMLCSWSQAQDKTKQVWALLPKHNFHLFFTNHKKVSANKWTSKFFYTFDIWDEHVDNIWKINGEITLCFTFSVPYWERTFSMFFRLILFRDVILLGSLL